MQAGPRNYDRSFDSATAPGDRRRIAAHGPREYLPASTWCRYAGHAVQENGLAVANFLNDDGTVNRGFGSDLEYDSQGEFVALIAEVARLDGGAASVREYLPKVRRTLEFPQQLGQASAPWCPATRVSEAEAGTVSRASSPRRSAMMRLL